MDDSSGGACSVQSWPTEEESLGGGNVRRSSLPVGFWWPGNPAGTCSPRGGPPVSVCPSPHVLRQDGAIPLLTNAAVKCTWRGFSERPENECQKGKGRTFCPLWMVFNTRITVILKKYPQWKIWYYKYSHNSQVQKWKVESPLHISAQFQFPLLNTQQPHVPVGHVSRAHLVT